MMMMIISSVYVYGIVEIESHHKESHGDHDHDDYDTLSSHN